MSSRGFVLVLVAATAGYILALVLMSLVASEGFWAGYFGNLMATLAGVALGVPVGLDLNRRAERQRQVAERRTYFGELTILVGQVVSHVERVRDTLRDVLEDMEGQHVVPRRLDHRTWSAVAPRVLPQLAQFGDLGVDTSAALADFFTEAEAIQDMLGHQLALAFSPSYTVGEGLNPMDIMTQAIHYRAGGLLGRSVPLLSLLSQVKGRASRAAQLGRVE